MPIHGLDYDPRKKVAARQALQGLGGGTFSPGDARAGLGGAVHRLSGRQPVNNCLLVFRRDG